MGHQKVSITSSLAKYLLPVLPAPERVEFERATKRDDQQQTAHQTADQGGRDDFPGDGGQAVPLVTAIQAVLLAIAAPRLKDAQVGAAVEVPRLAVVAVLLIRAIRTPLLVVTALRSRVAPVPPCGPVCTPLTRELSAGAGGAALLVAA